MTPGEAVDIWKRYEWNMNETKLFNYSRRDLSQRGAEEVSLCNGGTVGGGEPALVRPIPFHNTAARSPGWRRWAGRAGTRTRWCCPRCGSPGAWWTRWTELQEAQEAETRSQCRRCSRAAMKRVLPTSAAALCHMIPSGLATANCIIKWFWFYWSHNRSSKIQN